VKKKSTDPMAKLLEIENLVTNFYTYEGVVKALNKVSLVVDHGSTFGLVGESGCGKSTLGRAVLRLHEPTSGEVILDGQPVTGIERKALVARRREMQIIFQDPYSSLDPRSQIGGIIGEGLAVHGVKDPVERQERVMDILSTVGLAEDHVRRYPHEFSGGQRQRIGIARALVLRPKFIVCDEPVSALDVSIQAQVVNLLEDLQDRFSLTYLFIAHDLSMVRHISDRTAVMYLGKVVELATRNELYTHPLHPYTQALLSAVPVPDPIKERKRQRIILEGNVPSPVNPPKGCRFHTRCPLAVDVCKQEEPEWRDTGSSHWVACHLV